MTKIAANLFFKSIFLGLWLSCIACSPYSSSSSASDSLTSVNIIDRNGLSQTISAKERLKQYQHVDFLNPQPYQKVMRVYGRDNKGSSRAIITSYHPNGEPKQYLEVVNGRALGVYREWFSNGQLRLQARVIGGCADINAAAEKSWVFDGTCQAWHEGGNLAAEIRYDKGSLQGSSLYYHPSGQIWKKEPYHNNGIEGTVEIFCVSGELLQTSQYHHGKLHGSSIRYWCENNNNNIAAYEIFREGKILSSRYYNKDGTMIAHIDDGYGHRALFGKDSVCELQQYHDGVLDGQVQVFLPEGSLSKIYHVKNNLKHGEEIVYYVKNFDPDRLAKPSPQMCLNWHQGKVQGVVKTWFDNGQLESQREMSDNRKHGLSTAWYRNGSLMMIEEYDCDKLKKGEYLKIGESQPVSRVIDGNGVCTLFNADGNFLRKIPYSEGDPVR